ncbi:MAG: tRNA (guanosine(37)-N1)-methyltransferase TrmD [Cytophagales bacterium]|nr:tRNA (guanosine(37)-N1)-methyltransferase TrmD [Cytophagales bacterium]
MRIDIITCLPAMFTGFLDQSILKRAQENKVVEINIHNLREYSTMPYRQVDDYMFGGGAGMVLSIEPIDLCISALKAKVNYDEIIYMSPDGEMLTQKLCNKLSLCHNMILLCGHYKGVDERVRQYLITREVSIGNYVLSGGEIPAAVLADAVVRLLPGVLNDESSALTDSFQDDMLAPPVYTRPAKYKGWQVPEILLSGHKANIEKWQSEMAIKRTQERRPGLMSDL